MTADLLELALSDPGAAWDDSEELIASGTDPRALSFAYHARGIVLRDSGRTTEALTELRTALRYAGKADEARQADVRATYGITALPCGADSSEPSRFGSRSGPSNRRAVGEGR